MQPEVVSVAVFNEKQAQIKWALLVRSLRAGQKQTGGEAGLFLKAQVICLVGI